ncbi:2870_t:CDS:2 [Ambispora leptoticha]|uniref:2870_t:CDS:1 n=1 Tax=Ambispora leptoticha TaxID=144679 RepID=A0A9N8WNY4_9GLOM|nr:2870_t:CDS:2 [Ambispora leptoticha]
MGGGPRYPYPKEVWSPAGGWWSRPANWKSNTAIIGTGMLIICAITWKISAEKEVRYRPPRKWIPSMMWSKQFTEGEYKDIKFDEDYVKK